MNANFLIFLGKPWFVLAWYGVGALAACYAISDMRKHNTALKPAMKWAWPIIVFFFSVIGLSLYFLTARPAGISRIQDDEGRQKALDRYEESLLRRVNGAVIHCVAGDGLGIMTAMIIARASSMSFWQEFWFEYIVGFAIGWFIFQRKSMTMMTDSLPKQLAMAFRGEFFSMLTVMGGMGATMTYITPLVVSQQPKPLTAAFWGFGMLGLLVGYVLTFPMNYLMVLLGWKHGMGGMEGVKKLKLQFPLAKGVTISAMVLLGCAGLLLPAWLTLLRERTPLNHPIGALARGPEAAPGTALYHGFLSSVQEALRGLESGDRQKLAVALDQLRRIAEVGAYSAPGPFSAAREQVRDARLALNQDQTTEVQRHLENAKNVVKPASNALPPILSLSSYKGAQVVNQRGVAIGKVTNTSKDRLKIALGGWFNAWGFIDLSSGKTLTIDPRQVAFGPPQAIGEKLVALPTIG